MGTLALYIECGIIDLSKIERNKDMEKYVITAKKKGSDEAYLSAIFEDNKLVAVVQNKKVSSEVNTEDVAKFLLAIKSDKRYYPKNISDFINNEVQLIEAIDVIEDSYIQELDF